MEDRIASYTVSMLRVISSSKLNGTFWTGHYDVPRGASPRAHADHLLKVMPDVREVSIYRNLRHVSTVKRAEKGR